MKTKSYLISAILIILVYFVSRFIGERDYTFTSSDFYPEFRDSSLVSHNYFSLIYNEDREQADWVAYSVKPTNLETRFKRRNIFREDTLIKSGSATNKDYSKSGYDRGHLVPAGDMVFDSIALEETFYYSNISPQLAGFNRGVWKQLENHVRNLSSSYDSLLVLTGPVYSSGLEAIGENSVSVPGYFYKIIIQFRDNRVTSSSYLIPHKQGLKDFRSYRVSIDSIESATGFNFLYSLPVKLETQLER